MDACSSEIYAAYIPIFSHKFSYTCILEIANFNLVWNLWKLSTAVTMKNAVFC
jgi:hypothetical protein